METRDPNCDCGTCCDQCGHYEDCMSRQVPAYDPNLTAYQLA